MFIYEGARLSSFDICELERNMIYRRHEEGEPRLVKAPSWAYVLDSTADRRAKRLGTSIYVPCEQFDEATIRRDFGMADDRWPDVRVMRESGDDVVFEFSRGNDRIETHTIRLMGNRMRKYIKVSYIERSVIRVRFLARLSDDDKVARTIESMASAGSIRELPPMAISILRQHGWTEVRRVRPIFATGK